MSNAHVHALKFISRKSDYHDFPYKFQIPTIVIFFHFDFFFWKEKVEDSLPYIFLDHYLLAFRILQPVLLPGMEKRDEKRRKKRRTYTWD